MVDILTYMGRDADARGHIAARWRIPRIEFFDHVDSTQNIARTLADEGAPAWTLVIADHQSAGRGQHGREWHAAPGSSLMFSLLLRPRAVESIALVPIRTGLAIARALDRFLHPSVQAMLKWPNDIVLNDRKAGGILCEGQVRGEESVVIVGVGMNVKRFHLMIDERRDLPPAFIEEHLHREATRLDLLEAIIESMQETLGADSDELAPYEMEELARRDWLYGRILAEPHEGRAEGITSSGRLRIVGYDGVIRTITSGRVKLAE